MSIKSDIFVTAQMRNENHRNTFVFPVHQPGVLGQSYESNVRRTVKCQILRFKITSNKTFNSRFINETYYN